MVHVDDIMKYEAGEMEPEEIIAFFERLVADGTAWRLQGSYGRMAASLLSQGLIRVPGEMSHV